MAEADIWKYGRNNIYHRNDTTVRAFTEVQNPELKQQKWLTPAGATVHGDKSSFIERRSI